MALKIITTLEDPTTLFLFPAPNVRCLVWLFLDSMVSSVEWLHKVVLGKNRAVNWRSRTVSLAEFSKHLEKICFEVKF